jgi:hypothetical protein
MTGHAFRDQVRNNVFLQCKLFNNLVSRAGLEAIQALDSIQLIDSVSRAHR